MALPATVVWEVRTAGNDTNGGGFNSAAAGTDYSQQDNKNTVGNNISTTDAVGNGTTTLTSATASFTSAIVGNIIYLQGGTGALTASRYNVTGFTNSTTITLDRSVGAGTGITMNIGGAVASLGILGSTSATIIVDGHKIFIKAGTYSVTSATPNISNGCFSKANILYIEGYQTARGDLGTPPILQASGINTFTIFQIANDLTIKNITIDGAGLTSSRGFNFNGQTVLAYKCNAINCTNNGFISSNSATRYYYCTATGCSSNAAFMGGHFYNCVAYSNTVTGFRFGNLVTGGADRCLSYSNSGASSDGFICDNNGDVIFAHCVAYGNGRDGFRLDADNALVINCIAESNTGVGFNFGATNPRGGMLVNCGGFSSGTNVAMGTGTFTSNTGFITGSGSFFTNAASGDFSLNNTSGRGAALRAAGLPGVFPVGLTTGYIDVGAAQHQDSGGGGSSEHSAVF